MDPNSPQIIRFFEIMASHHRVQGFELLRDPLQGRAGGHPRRASLPHHLQPHGGTYHPQVRVRVPLCHPSYPMLPCQSGPLSRTRPTTVERIKLPRQGQGSQDGAWRVRQASGNIVVLKLATAHGRAGHTTSDICEHPKSIL